MLEQLTFYCNLGYDITLTQLYGKDAIRMVKRYSHIAEKEVICEQIIEHDALRDEHYLNKVLTFMYENIEQQEKTKTFYEPN
jgi:hypothetical protein